MKKTIFLFLNFFGLILFAQNLEVKVLPLINDFTPTLYQNAKKIWDINANKNGILHIVADRGLPKFDGKKSYFYKANKGFTHSLLVQDNPLIYSQSDVDFGVWKWDKFNEFNHQSPYPKKTKTVDDHKKFLRVYKNANQIVLASQENIHPLKSGKSTLIKATSNCVNIPNYGNIKACLHDNLNISNIKTYIIKDFESTNFNFYSINRNSNLNTNCKNYLFSENSNKCISNEQQTKIKNDNLPLNLIKIPTIISKDYIFHPINNGLALAKINKSINKQNFNPTLFRGIEFFNNSQAKTSSLNTKIDYDFNNVRPNFLVPKKQNLLYQYKINRDKNWSFWKANNQFIFLNLKEGNDDFYIKAKISNHINPIKKIGFIILPPFYRSWYAYFVYLSVAFLMYFLYRKKERKTLEDQRRLLLKRQQKKLERQSEKFQKEKITQEQKQLEKDKFLLQQQVKNKTIELAVKAKEDDDKTRLLVNIKEKIQDALKNPAQSVVRQKEIKRLIDNSLKSEDHTFEIQMDELHQSFFKNLQMAHPVLSIYDLRLCAYLKTGLSTQEISEILDVLPSSLYVKRSRLRKKLDLGPDDDLYSFLSRF